MPQLPRVAVLGAGRPGLTALRGLIDGGLDAVALDDVDPEPDSGDRAAYVAEFALGDHVRRVDAPLTVRALGPEPAAATGTYRGPFTVGGDSGSGGEVFDAVVIAGRRHLAAVATALTLGPDWAPNLYFGVFPPGANGVFAVALGPAPDHDPTPHDPTPHGSAAVHDPAFRLAETQGRLIGEFLRGRYRPPPAGTEPSQSGNRRTRWSRWRRVDPIRAYLRSLEPELRAGHARAEAAGYSLPLPRHDVPA